MNTLFLMTLNAGTSYWRLFNPAMAMQQSGKTIALYPEFDPKFPYVHTWEEEILTDSTKGTLFGNLMVWADIVVGQRFSTHAGLAIIDTIQQEFKKKFFTEVDDDVYHVPADHPASAYLSPGSELLKISEKQLQLSDGLIVSTEYLKRAYKEQNKKIHIVPNALDFDLWKFKPTKKKRKFINIGYVGGQQHTRDLKILNKVIPPILDKYKKVQFTIWGGDPKVIPERERVIKHFTFAPVLDYPGELAKMNYDIGIAPLVDNYLNRSKSNLRWLEYSALGIPTVASPIEPFNQASPIFIAKKPDEWIEMLSHLIENEEVRKTVGHEARLKVQERYDIKNVAAKYYSTLEKEVNGNA
jgi:glycosyltransferase involved in cell wall biosynthesis